MAITKSKIVACVAEEAGITKKQAGVALDTLTKLAYKGAKDGFTIPGVGKLVIRNTPKRPAREGRNPATGETIMIAAKPAGKKLVFRVAKAAKVAVLKK
jgi:DNA-binding protein HU-beta